LRNPASIRGRRGRNRPFLRRLAGRGPRWRAPSATRSSTPSGSRASAASS